MSFADDLAKALNIISEAGLKAPLSLHQKVYDNQMSDNGQYVQVWKCKKKGHNWGYKAPIVTLEVSCPEGHDCEIVWQLPKVPEYTEQNTVLQEQR